ncbi:hypothetical protein KHA93_11650 [Bacillus sp. FJAT-49732]|uniref:Uncharacterized protein n=1 Tax=Lederbergia citrisecunda TaxID=2833583 RepID=A0A942YM39_9BACI|nr:hypothetical protein [Lederbergia citrisecunda]MBS4200285.1 hypothetical protein [Lederbergia citrisecunda]
MTIILSLCIPLTAFVVGFLVLKSVQLGLRWQIQTAKQEPPTMENPIQPILDSKQEDDVANILDEWVNGVQEGR